jgi:hypothetical protein
LVQPAFPPLSGYNQRYPISGLDNWAIPHINQIGKTVYPEVEDAGYLPRAFFFRGIQPGSNALKTYPLAAMGDLDYTQNSVGNYSLSWGNEAANTAIGLLEEFWNGWIVGRDEELEWEQAIYLDLEAFLSLDWHIPYRLQTPDGEIDGVIKKINMVLTDHGIKNVVATFFKL